MVRVRPSARPDRSESRWYLSGGEPHLPRGIAAGAVVIILTENAILLTFVATTGILAWSYSARPLRLRDRGLAELPSFVAFQPLLAIEATVALGGAGLRNSPLLSAVLGLLAAGVSYGRYFPTRKEDTSKAKRTPVTIFDPKTGRRILYGIPFAPYVVGIVWVVLREGYLWIVALIVSALFVTRLRGEPMSAKRWDHVIAMTIARHAIVGVALVYDLIS